MNKELDPNLKMHFEVVELSALPQMQAKINQWITTKILVKYKTTVVVNQIFFECILKKSS